MLYNWKNINWFTLVEVIVSVTIFSVMIISIIWIYIVSTDITLKSDINRMMQENIKNVTSTMAEDIRKNWIAWVSDGAVDANCDITLWSNLFKKWDKLCTNSWEVYYLAKWNDSVDQYIRVDESECDEIHEHCSIVGGSQKPLTNSFLSVKSLDFYVSKDSIPKVTMNIIFQPAVGKWVKTDLIQQSKITFQTTMSERPF